TLDDFDIQGHRGCRGLYPENTLAGFKYAMEEIGVDTLELDVGITKDMVLVVNHDTYLNPERTMKDGVFIAEKNFIKDLTLEQLKEYSVGKLRNRFSFYKQKQLEDEKMPTLQEVIDLVKDFNSQSEKQVNLNVETKVNVLAPDETHPPEVFVQLLLEIIEENNIEEIISIQSFYWKTIMDVKEQAPHIETVALLSNARLKNLEWFNGLNPDDFNTFGEFVKASDADCFSMNYRDISKKQIQEVQDLGIKVIPYTINDAPTMSYYIELGVDGIITDYPDVLKSVVEAYFR
ncbi:MAG: glycerophosphodiester phosphodiesterase family protein, partial [Thermotogota bacterium]